MSRTKYLLLALGLFIRIALPKAHSSLERTYVVTPLVSYQRVQEGIELYRSGLDPYQSDVFHHAPIFLLMGHLSDFWIQMLYVASDALIAWIFLHLARYQFHQYQQEEWKKPQKLIARKSKSQDDKEVETLSIPSSVLSDSFSSHIRDIGNIQPVDVAILYLLNPFSVLTCLSRSTQVFTNLAATCAIFSATKGKVDVTGFFIAFATYLGIYPILLTPALFVLLSRHQEWQKKSQIGLFLWLAFSLLANGALFTGLSYSLLDSWSFIRGSYGVVIFVSDLSPNVGLYWYFFIEMFEQFRTFFIALFHLTCGIFAIPISIRLSNHPLFAIFLISSIIAIFKSYPSLGDSSFYMALILLHPPVFRYAQHSFFSLSALAYACILGPMFFNLWVYDGSGNANFFYAITLVFTLAHVVFVMDCAFALIRREWDRTHPGWRLARVQLIHK